MGKHRKWIQLAIFSIVLAIGVFTIVTNLSSKAPDYPKVGSKAPDFSLLGLDGAVHKLSDVSKNKIVVLNFWGTFCDPCKNEMPVLQRQADKWKSSAVTVLGVNQDISRITAQQFAKEYGVSFMSVHDEKQTVRVMYGVTDYPTTMFIGKDGTVKEIRIGEMTESVIDQTISRIVNAG
jgi:peroxiredoxin